MAKKNEGVQIDLPEEIYKKLLEGDPRATFAKGSSVKKVLEEEGDSHSLGSIGVVKGSLYHPEIGSIYLIQYNNEKDPHLTIEAKLEQHWGQNLSNYEPKEQSNPETRQE